MQPKTPFQWPNLWGGIMQRLRLGSVMDSPIAVILIVGTLLAVAMVKGTTWLIIAILTIFVPLILLFGVIYIVWSIKDP